MGLERAPLEEVWQWAVAHWRPGLAAGMKTGPVPGTRAADESLGSSSK